VTLDRPHFIGGASALIGCSLASSDKAAAQLARSGQTPISRAEFDAGSQELFGSPSFTCVQTAQMTEGPYYYETSLERQSITEGRPGEPLRLLLALGGIIEGGCFPLRGAVVDVWQADADGMYSNVGADLQVLDTTGQTFMRGHQFTGDRGNVQFDTVVPGWELVSVPPPVDVILRTTHIHIKAYHGREVLTAQLFFPDRLINQLYAEQEPYRSNRSLTGPSLSAPVRRIGNADDMFFTSSKARPMAVERIHGVLTAKATIGMITIANSGITPLFR
jgi:protocatechuate 3,4-dioxygenase beta subunit